jgi:hypothetical protein
MERMSLGLRYVEGVLWDIDQAFAEANTHRSRCAGGRRPM